MRVTDYDKAPGMQFGKSERDEFRKTAADLLTRIGENGVIA